MGGNTKLLRLYILHRELLFWDCIHFVLHRATDVRYMRHCDTESESFAVALTSRNDAVDVWRRISVLWESWNTLTRLLLSTATVRHKKLQGLTHEADKKSQTFGSFVNVKDIREHQCNSYLGYRSKTAPITCRYNCKCWLVLQSGRLPGCRCVCWRFGRCPPRWHTPGQGYMDQDEARVDWAGAATTGRKSNKDVSSHFN